MQNYTSKQPLNSIALKKEEGHETLFAPLNCKNIKREAKDITLTFKHISQSKLKAPLMSISLINKQVDVIYNLK